MEVTERRDLVYTMLLLAARALGVLGIIVAYPRVVVGLGAENAGVWAAACSIVQVATLLDLGMGAALTNSLSAGPVASVEASAQHRSATAYLIVLGVSLFGVGAFAATRDLIPWARLIQDSVTSEGRSAMTAVAVCSALSLPGAVCSRMLLATERGVQDAIVTIVANGASVATVYYSDFTGKSVAFAVAVTAGVPALIKLFYSISVISADWPQQEFELGKTITASKALLKSAIPFGILQATGAISFSSDVAIVASKIGAHTALHYALILRLTVIPQAFIQALSGPFWARIAREMAAGDVHSALQRLRRGILYCTFAFGIPGLAILVASEIVFSVLAPGTAAPDLSLIFSIIFAQYLFSMGSLISVALNAASIVWLQIALSCALASISLPLRIWSAEHLGSAAVPLVGLIAYLAISLMPSVLALKSHLLRRRQEQ